MAKRAEAGGGSVFFRTNEQRWVYSYQDANGQWRQHRLPAGIGNKAQAEIAGRAWLAKARASGTVGAKPRRGESFTIKTLARQWLAERNNSQELKGTTKYSNDSYFTCHILPQLGSTQIDLLTVSVLRDWVRDLKEKRLSASRIRAVHSAFGQFFQWAIDDGKTTLQTNPVKTDAVRVLLPREQRPKVDHISLDDFGKLIANPDLPTRWCLRFLLAGYGGFRDGEIAGLRICDVHLDEEVPFVEVVQNCTPLVSDGGLGITTPKTESSYRPVPIHPTMLEMLRWWLADGWEIENGRRPNQTDALIASKVTGSFGRPRSASTLRQYLEAVGVPSATASGRARRFHMLRACFATWLDELGVEENTVGSLLGHGPRTVTKRHYTAKVLRKLQAAIHALPAKKVHCAGYCAGAQAPDSYVLQNKAMTDDACDERMRSPGSEYESALTHVELSNANSTLINDCDAIDRDANKHLRTTKNAPAQWLHNGGQGGDDAKIAEHGGGCSTPCEDDQVDAIMMMSSHPLGPVARALAIMRCS